MIPEKMNEVLRYEGVVSVVTQGVSNPHVVNTWNSYLKITENERILAPVGGMNTTEENLKQNNKVLMTLGSREVKGFNSMGTGFLISGTASIVYDEKNLYDMKQKFPWARAVLEISPESIIQTL